MNHCITHGEKLIQQALARDCQSNVFSSALGHLHIKISPCIFPSYSYDAFQGIFSAIGQSDICKITRNSVRRRVMWWASVHSTVYKTDPSSLEYISSVWGNLSLNIEWNRKNNARRVLLFIFDFNTVYFRGGFISYIWYAYSHSCIKMMIENLNLCQRVHSTRKFQLTTHS